MTKKALIIIDMFNTFDFPDSANLVKASAPVAKNILKLKDRFRKKNLPIIYVNDNFGKWKDSWDDIYSKCSQSKSKGRNIALILKPEKTDYFILKPKNSGFFDTSLDSLLKKLQSDELIITGIAADICVLFTAHDAHIRNYRVIVPKDCIAAAYAKDKNACAHILKKIKISQPKSTHIKI